MGSVEAAELNRLLVAGMKERGCLRSAALEAAFLAVPRHHFLPGLPLEAVYRDEAIPTKRIDGTAVSSSSQPAIMAEMLLQLDVRAGCSVLEIGAGTGYNAALLAHLSGRRGSVISVDIDPDVVAGARRNLDAAGIAGVNVVQADGGYGHPPGSPYDRLVITAGAADIPPAWWEQLKTGGRLVLPLVLGGGMQAAVCFLHHGDRLESVAITHCLFMPLRGAFADLPREARLSERVNVLAERPDTIDGELVLGWLQEEPRTSLPGVELVSADDLARCLAWLGLREPGYVVVVDGGPDEPYRYRGGLLAESGLALLERPFIQSYGSSAEAGEALAAQLAAWDAAGRPGLDSVRIRAYPKGRAPELKPGERALDRPSTTLLVSA